MPTWPWPVRPTRPTTRDGTWVSMWPSNSCGGGEESPAEPGASGSTGAGGRRRHRPGPARLRPLGRHRERGEPHGVPGTPGQIQVTQATYELLRAEFELEPRGTVPDQGQGQRRDVVPGWPSLGQDPTAPCSEPEVGRPVAISSWICCQVPDSALIRASVRSTSSAGGFFAFRYGPALET